MIDKSADVSSTKISRVESEADDRKRNLVVISASLLIGTLLMGSKFFAYWITGSSAILSDALESIINVVASAFALGSVILAAKPPDEDHPYGHGKIEYFSAGFEGALIIFAALGIFFEGARQIYQPRDLDNIPVGLAILVGAGLVNLVMGLILVRTGRKTGSLILIADGKHLLTDVYTSALVLVGLAAVEFTGTYRIDGVIACIAGINIVFSGVKLVRHAFLGLMDASDPDLLEEICRILIRHKRNTWIDVHKLRAWRSGNRVHVDFHLILPRNIPLEESHKEVKDLENIFQNHFHGPTEILIHLDPCTDPECPICSVDCCDSRSIEKSCEIDWQRDNLVNDAAVRLAACPDVIPTTRVKRRILE